MQNDSMLWEWDFYIGGCSTHNVFIYGISGRRNCLGESLARVQLFLFFVTLMQRYSVSLPAGSTADPSQTTTDMVRTPKPYDIIFHPRKED